MEYWLIKTGEDGEPGINGGLAKKNPISSGTVNTIDVTSVEEYSKKIQAEGGKVTQGMPVRGKDTLPIALTRKEIGLT